HIDSKEDLLYETMQDGAAAFHAALDAIPEELPTTERIRLALRAHLRTVAEQLDVATVFVREWRYLEGERREEMLGERRRDEERLPAVEAVLGAAAEQTTIRTEHPGHAVELAGAAARDADAIFVFSGDGGFNEALNGSDGRVPLGFIPGGGTSVLPRALGLPREPVAAARRLGEALAAGRTRRISLGRMNGRRFGFSCGV